MIPLYCSVHRKLITILKKKNWKIDSAFQWQSVTQTFIKYFYTGIKYRHLCYLIRSKRYETLGDHF